MIHITSSLTLDETEIEYEFVRAGGPGGQNVNKVATAVQLRFNVAHSPSLTEEVRVRLTKLAGKRITAEGLLLIEARRFRAQERNRADALARLIELIRRASQKPKPRRHTRPTQSSREQRLQGKQRHGQTKRLRQSRPGDEE